ncbi:MAG: hypothetical protein ABIA21_00460 [Candidatus Aenigmatarchaeota archaeon]
MIGDKKINIRESNPRFADIFFRYTTLMRRRLGAGVDSTEKATESLRNQILDYARDLKSSDPSLKRFGYVKIVHDGLVYSKIGFRKHKL